MSKKYKIILFALTLLLSSHAHSFPYPFIDDEPKITARIHCQLMLHSSGDVRPISPMLLENMLSDVKGSLWLDNEEVSTIFNKVGSYPDMGFIIGLRWHSMTLPHRIEFNRIFTGILTKKYGLMTPWDYTKTCRIKLRNLVERGDGTQVAVVSTTLPVIPNPKGEEPPATHSCHDEHVDGDFSIVQALFRNDKCRKPTYLSYLLEKEEPYPWRIVEMSINGELQHATYRGIFNEMIAGYGMNFLRKLEGR